MKKLVIAFSIVTGSLAALILQTQVPVHKQSVLKGVIIAEVESGGPESTYQQPEEQKG